MVAAAKPKPKPVKMGPATIPTVRRSGRQAALDLLAYVSGDKPDFGYKGHPSAVVRAAQVDMGVVPDGIYGPTTRNAGRELTGRAFPPRR
jgi:peptidoglycan hydrolase-like protein with peptidoglycan-binding domain